MRQCYNIWAYNSDSRHIENKNNNFTTLDRKFSKTGYVEEEPGKEFNINISKECIIIHLNLLYNYDNSYIYVNGKNVLIVKTKQRVQEHTFGLDRVSVYHSKK